jgi:hypothetical protein
MLKMKTSKEHIESLATLATFQCQALLEIVLSRVTKLSALSILLGVQRILHLNVPEPITFPASPTS